MGRERKPTSTTITMTTTTTTTKTTHKRLPTFVNTTQLFNAKNNNLGFILCVP
jgi:hypothetical protein